jgi:hypothetical protein
LGRDLSAFSLDIFNGEKKKMASLMTAPTQTFSAETIAAQVRKAVHECEVIDGIINN